jgi:thioredoxin reductase (NADPH)
MEKVDYDLVIIGGGPAGLTAGIYAARARLNTILFEKVVPGGQILVTDWIENYPGHPEGISGADLVTKMTEQAEKFGLTIASGEAASMDVDAPVKKIDLGDRTVTCHAVIIATGASPRKLGIPGEGLYFGKGVSACATCDAPFFRDKVVAAVGGGDTAVQESVFLTKFVRKVYLIHRRDRLRAEAILQERALENDKIEMVWDSVVTAVTGKDEVQGVSLRNVKTGEEKDLAVDGVFIWIGITPNTGFLDGQSSIETDDGGFIVVDNNLETGAPGVFAAGDVRNTPLRQIATAVGDAAIAAFSAEHYIESLRL